MKRTQPMMNYKQGDVVLLEVVFTEGIGKKKRPALILSNDYYHKGRQEVIIAAITSNVHRVLPGDTVITEWESAGLKFPSLVAGILQTMKREMIIRKFGALTKKDFKKVKRNIKKLLFA
ncbi:MAG: type II toxin-antitoxin system PemK/MazF family toxin [bacterium]